MAIMHLATLISAASILNPVVSVHPTQDGVDMALRTGELRVEAITPDVVRVRYSLDGRYPGSRVPIVISHDPTPKFRVSSNRQTVVLATAQMRVEINRATSAVVFRDAAGHEFLSERAGSRALTPVAQDLRSDLRFILPPHEGIYGLGQHQDGFLDHRGSVVNLVQENREVAIPFLLSSRGYGLLWNNPAATRVNVGIGDEISDAANFTDEQGHSGLTAHYFRDENLGTEVGARTDPRVDFDWTKTPPMGLPHDHYSVRWSGFAHAGPAGTYKFSTRSDDGARLWIDGKLVIDDWSVHPATIDSATVRFDANSSHRIRLEYFQGGGEAVISLKSGMSQPSGDVRWSSETSEGVDYYVFYGPNPNHVMAEYRHATGEAPLPPKWALGFWQSKERYASQKEWIDIASEYRRRRLPIDNLVQDWFYWDPHPWGSHMFDAKRYPDPAAGIASLHADFHLHFMISVWGKFNPGSTQNPDPNFDALDTHGFLYPPLGGGDRYFDAFNPEARRLYWSQMRDQIFAKGVDAWWLDASEPEVDMSAFRRTPTAAGPGSLVLNAWPLMHTTGVSEGQLAAAPDKRPFILTRSAYAGQQRTGAATWSGDITATWNVYAAQIPAGLNFGLSGIPYWTTDIGAFFAPPGRYPGGASNPEYRELFTRWFQFGAFCPIFRVHGTDFAKELWRFGPETGKILRKYDELRYQLMPYIYAQAWGVTSRAELMMRALVLDFPQDATAREVKDEFMFGPSLLVCPVIQRGALNRSVYLPRGAAWTDFSSGLRYAGGQTVTAAAPIDTIPIFVRSGSLIPLGPPIQYVDERPADPIDILIYPGGSSKLDLYEDDGTNRRYLSGEQATIPISWDERLGSLTIGARNGSYPRMLALRTFRVRRVDPSVPNHSWKTVRYDGRSVSVSL